MAPASQAIFSKGHQVLKSIKIQGKQKKPSFLSITAIRTELFQKDKI